MAFEGIKITDITAAHLNALIGVSEGRNLDFKQENYGRADDEKRKFLADICAFANTIGGHIIIGVTEEGGTATGVLGITGDADAERLRLEGVARNGLEPSLIGLHIQPVTLDGGRFVLVIEVPKSWNSPHRITAQGINRFYLRAGGGNYEPEVDELRLLFTAAPTISQKMRDFRHERVAKILASDTPVPVRPYSPLILHIFPFSAFSTPTRFSARALSDARMGFMPIITGGTNFRTNLDGFVMYTMPLPTSSYTMIWKNGCLEATSHNLIHEHEGQAVCPIGIITSISRHGFRYLNSLRELGVSPPIAFFITLTGTKGARLTMPNQFFFDNDNIFDREPLPITEIIIEEYPPTQQALQTLLKAAFDEIANAAGYEAAPNYDINGNVIP